MIKSRVSVTHNFYFLLYILMSNYILGSFLKFKLLFWSLNSLNSENLKLRYADGLEFIIETFKFLNSFSLLMTRLNSIYNDYKSFNAALDLRI